MVMRCAAHKRQNSTGPVIQASVRSTSVAPDTRLQKISSTDTSKAIDANCSTRSFGPNR